jgi:hypothetical protein
MRRRCEKMEIYRRLVFGRGVIDRWVEVIFRGLMMLSLRVGTDARPWVRRTGIPMSRLADWDEVTF